MTYPESLMCHDEKSWHHLIFHNFEILNFRKMKLIRVRREYYLRTRLWLQVICEKNS